MRVEYFPLKEDVILQNEAPTDLYIFVIGAALGDAPAEVPAKKAKEKYIAPHLRARAGNKPEEYTQIRIRLLNRLSESNVESITGELSLIFQVSERIA
ncbi:hypothetical protein JHK82_031190 [Glycine max]|nr:hypothetical protein JHK85_031837 [Glycine max]KAG5124453.1 hypothetical protein JHK82_031190 [Glycine max]